MKNRRVPIFYIVYFVLLLLFLLALCGALRMVRVFLADYESAQPQYEAERIFETYYANGDFDALIEEADITLSEFETKSHLKRYLEEYLADKTITYTSITTGLDDRIRYIVKADDVKFSSFTLTKSGESTEKGFALYTLDSMELYTSGQHSFTITVPGGYAVYVNDLPLDESRLIGEREPHISCEHMPDGVSGIEFVTYRVESLYYAPERVQVFSNDGRACELCYLGDDTAVVDILYSDSLKEAYFEYVVLAAQAIAAYMQNDGRFSAAAVYLDPESELYTNLRTSETYFVIDHASYSFEDIHTSEFIAYDDNTFSCRVSFTHVLKRYGSQDYRDYIDMTLYFRRVGDTFLIYDRYNH